MIALATFFNIVFRKFELVGHELQHRGARKIGNREHRFENSLKSFVGTAALRLLHHQELVVRRLLDLDEVRHLRASGPATDDRRWPSDSVI
jgi:hypothetical protein